MSEREYRRDICPECKVREGISSRKRIYQCSYCGRWFCKRHLEPRLVNIADFKRIIKDVSWQHLIEKEWRRKDAHPDFQYTKERWQELRFEKELTWAKIEAFLDGSRGYGKPVSAKPQRENKCQVCDKKLDLPFRCSYCQDYFCVDHKLPENHQCLGLPKERFWYQKKRKLAEVTERGVNKCPKCGSGSIGVLSFDRKSANLRCQICGYEWKQPRSERPYPKPIPRQIKRERRQYESHSNQPRISERVSTSQRILRKYFQVLPNFIKMVLIFSAILVFEYVFIKPYFNTTVYIFVALGTIYIVYKLFIIASRIRITSDLRLWGLRILSGITFVIGILMLVGTLMSYAFTAFTPEKLDNPAYMSVFVFFGVLGLGLVVLSSYLMFRFMLKSGVIVYPR